MAVKKPTIPPARRPPPRPTAARPAAKAKAKPKAKPASVWKKSPKIQKRKPVSMKNQLLLTAVCVVLLAAALPTALLLSIALLPMACAFLVDRTQGRYATLSVGALNFAATWPFLLKLWSSGHSVVNAMKTVLDPVAWLIIYSAAAVGWVLYHSFPSCVSLCMSIFAGHRVSQLRQQQKKLIEEWGPEVASHHTAPRA
jgi:hypothetical protein